MEDTIEVILQDHSRVLSTDRPHPAFSACLGALLTGVYGVWSLFATPGFRRVPWRLKVLDITCLFFFFFFFYPPALPSFKYQMLHVCMCEIEEKEADA